AAGRRCRSRRPSGRPATAPWSTASACHGWSTRCRRATGRHPRPRPEPTRLPVIRRLRQRVLESAPFPDARRGGDMANAWTCRASLRLCCFASLWAGRAEADRGILACTHGADGQYVTFELYSERTASLRGKVDGLEFNCPIEV